MDELIASDPVVRSFAPEPTKSLLVSGGVAADGTPYLDPAFVVDATPDVPDAAGPYRLEGRRVDGNPLFSVAFEMPEISHGDGESVFVFALPVQPEWATELVSLILSGPSGGVELREGSESPTVMALDPQTGELRAILDDPAVIPSRPLTQRDFDRILPQPGLDVRVSRGLPPAEDWIR